MSERHPSVSSDLRIDGSTRDTLADRAYRSIRVAIINHELVPGRYYSEAWLAGLLGLYRTGDLKLDELITRRYRLEEINQGYQDMLEGRNIRGVIVHEH